MALLTSRLAIVGLAVILLVAPLIGGIAYADHAAREVVKEQAALYAQDALHRSDATTRQVDDGLAAISAARPGACSDVARSVMRDVDMISSYIQAVGYVEGQHLVCSSLTDVTTPLPLGPVDFVSPTGVQVRISVRFPFAPERRFIVVQRDSYVAIVHKALPIDVTTISSGVGIATLGLPGKQVLARRGQLDPAWAEGLRRGQSSSFVSEGRAVALAGSKHYFIGAVAALPRSALTDELSNTRREVMPLAALISTVLVVGLLLVARRRTSVVSEMRAGLRHDEFFLLYQPIVELESRRVVGAEALMRWRRHDSTLVPPDLFIKAAENAGIVGSITHRLVELIQRDAGDLFLRHPDFYLTLNLAASDLEQPGTVDLLSDLASSLSIPPGGLVAEITERGFLDPDMARPVLAALKRAGLTIAIDDFGTGYSSLASLQSMDIDVLKIDRTFVDSLGADAATSQVVFHIITMARALNLRLVAEGVGTEEQARALLDHGVTHAQGWLFARPAPLAEVVQALERQAVSGERKA